MASLSVLILAAGKGTRMKSRQPKVLHPVAGIPMIDRVLNAVRPLKPKDICVIVGHEAETVVAHVRSGHPHIAFARQRRLDGSGGAVRQALGWLRRQRGEVLVTCGDAPLLTPETFQSVIKGHRREHNQATVLTAILPTPAAYGRIVRGDGDAVERIVEFLDASPVERRINEVNTGTYLFDARALSRVLPKLTNKNAKREYYLTDTLELLRRDGGRIGGVVCPDPDETLGINSRADLAIAEKVVYRRNAERLMTGGVTIVDPDTTYIGDDVEVGADSVIWPQTYLLGRTQIGTGSVVGPWSFVRDSVFENDVVFQASFSDEARVRTGSRIGPWTRLRPRADVGPDAHVGNFTELKNTRLGPGAKANHLSYLGDATVGKNVNIGAGTITCNYDGLKKFPTEIRDNAFIGSNVNLIAPVRVGAHAVVGAGSSISEDVPDWSLALERARPLIKKNWAKRLAKDRKR